MIDEVAEHIRTLGHFADGRLKDFIRSTRLQEQDYTSDQAEQLKNWLADHESIIINIRKNVDKIGTSASLQVSRFCNWHHATT